MATLALRERPKQRGPSAFGLVLCLLGTLAMAFFYFQFDVSVLANGMRIANLNLMSQRQNGIWIEGILFLAGILVMRCGAARNQKISIDNPKRFCNSQ